MTSQPWGCHRTAPLPHPCQPIPDCACGYDFRLLDPRCSGCHRSRPESPQDQLDALRALGDAALDQRRVPPKPPHGAP